MLDALEVGQAPAPCGGQRYLTLTAGDWQARRDVRLGVSLGHYPQLGGVLLDCIACSRHAVLPLALSDVAAAWVLAVTLSGFGLLLLIALG